MKTSGVIFAIISSICATLLFFRVADGLAFVWWAAILGNLVFVIVRATRQPKEADRDKP